MRRMVLGVTAGLVMSLGAVVPAEAALSTMVTGQRRTCTIVGTAGADRLRGTARNDVICGLGGNDVIVGGDGNDVIDGGAGNDAVQGGSGNDIIAAGAGDDTVAGDGGDDRIDAGPGNDTVAGNPGTDRINGGTGDDRIDGGPGADDMQGGTGVNTCHRDAADTSPVSSCQDLRAPVVYPETAQWDEPVVDNASNQYTVLRMRVTDDRAGISYAWIEMRSPDGYTTWGNAAEPVSGTANDGVYEFRVYLPALSATGEWRVLNAGAVDRVNRQTWERIDGVPLTVTGDADKTAPVAYPDTAQWLTPTTLDNSRTRHVALSMRVTDDRSGVWTGAVILAPADGGPSAFLTNTKLLSGDAHDGVWTFEADLPAYTSTGEWRVLKVNVGDRVTNSSSAAMQMTPIAVTGVTDVIDPVADISSAIWLSPAVIDNSTDRDLRFRIRLTDDLAGVGPQKVTIASVDSPEASMDLTGRLISGTRTDGIWEITGTLPAWSPTGVWQVAINIVDGVGHRAFISSANGLPTFTVVPPAR